MCACSWNRTAPPNDRLEVARQLCSEHYRVDTRQPHHPDNRGHIATYNGGCSSGPRRQITSFSVGGRQRRRRAAKTGWQPP